MTQTDFIFGSISIKPGERKDIRVKIAEVYMATPLYIPLTIINGVKSGPTLFITAALHGNELNGIEIVRQIRTFVKPNNLSGVVILVPIANPISFINQMRELPDGRDLNRAFPGSKKGSIAAQIAYAIFNKIVQRSNYGIDIHSAPHGRTNLPHVRGDMSLPEVRRFAKSFGTGVIFDLRGEKGTLRYQACKRGIPTIVYEAGEPLKFQKNLIQKGVRGIKNVMAELGMLPIKKIIPPSQIIIKEHKWIRAKKGGILILDVKVGDVVKKGDVIAFNTKPFGTKLDVLKAPFTGLVVGITTIPMVIPGSAVCHLLKLDRRVEETRRLTILPR